MKIYKRIHICNFFGSRNKGDELALKGALNLFRSDIPVSFTISTFGNVEDDRRSIPQGRILKAFGGHRNVVEAILKTLFFAMVYLGLRSTVFTMLHIFGRQYRPLVEAIKSADFVLVAGGPFLKENFRFGIIPTGNLIVSLLEPFVAMLFGKPLLILGQAFSASYSFAGRKMMQRIIDYAQVTVARDPASCAHANRLGAKKMVIHRPDLAFLALKPVAEERKPQIAVNVRLLSPSQLETFSRSIKGSAKEIEALYMEQHAKGIQAILDLNNDLGVTFINQAIENDRIAAQWTISLMKRHHGRCIVQDDGTDATEVLREICISQFAIVTRYHSSLMAICSGTPFVACSYDQKVAELLKYWDREESLISDLASLPTQIFDSFQLNPSPKIFDISKAQREIISIRGLL